LREYEFLDVYDLDAQIGHFPSPPPAVRRYLSGGRSLLHLQDANWERDFAVSSAQISDLVTDARRPRPDLIIAVNSTLVERLLAQLQTHLPDYQLRDEHDTLITSDNFTELARRDHRLTAYPRQPKTRFLRFFGQRLWQVWRDLSLADRLAIIRLLYGARSDRLWQAYSPHLPLETIFVQIGADGRMHQAKKCNNFYFVLSNVGINKADHHVSLTFADPQLQLDAEATSHATYTVHVTNNNVYDPDAIITDRQIWINYVRLILPRWVSITDLTWDGTSVTTLDYRPLTDSYGQRWNEWGFLLVAAEGSSHDLRFSLAGPGQCWLLSR